MAKKTQNGITNSVVGEGNAKITNTHIGDNKSINITWHAKSLVTGFVAGVLSSLLASYIWEHFLK